MIAGYVAFSILLLVVLLWERALVLRFLRAHDSIADAAALSEFKQVARWNMYGALAVLGAGVVQIAWCALLVFRYGGLGLIILLSSCIASLFLGLNTKKIEARARGLECIEDLKSEYSRVSEVWVKKALPDF